MTVNAFLFSWDQHGVEAIVPITQYETAPDVEAAVAVLSGEKPKRNPLNDIANSIIWRARANGQRHYEVYAIDCTEDYTEASWREMWEKDPQFCADLIRERGVKLFCNRALPRQGVRVV